MADHVFLVSPNIELACYNNGLEKTLLQVKAPATMRVKLLGWSIAFDGVSITAEPAIVEIARQTTVGAMIPLNPIDLKLVPETIQSTCQYSASVEPTKGEVIDNVEVHPQSGYEVKYPEGQEPIIGMDGYIGLIVKVAAGVNCRVKMICEE